MAKTGIIENPDLAEIQRNARYGHTDWIMWKNRAGKFLAARRTAGVIKQAMLDVGTSGRFSLICASSATSMVVTWSLALILRRNTIRGY